MSKWCNDKGVWLVCACVHVSNLFNELMWGGRCRRRRFNCHTICPKSIDQIQTSRDRRDGKRQRCTAHASYTHTHTPIIDTFIQIIITTIDSFWLNCPAIVAVVNSNIYFRPEFSFHFFVRSFVVFRSSLHFRRLTRLFFVSPFCVDYLHTCDTQIKMCTYKRL